MGYNVVDSVSGNREAARAAHDFVVGSFGSTDPYGEERNAERARIARELHDTLLQGFFSVSMQLQAVVDYLPHDSAAKTRLTGIVQLVGSVLEEGRLAVEGLRSTRKTSKSLGQAFAALPVELGYPSKPRLRVYVEGRQRELKASVYDDVYRIGREAMINACRHSGASEITIEIVYRSSELRISVLDNGCGIDAEELPRTGHWGLLGMRERAERIGARLRILSRAALGTEVELSVPGRMAFE